MTPAVALMLCAASIGGCGGASPRPPKAPSNAAGRATSASGDEVVLTIGGRRFEARESGSVRVRVSGAPELNHDGAVGCSGRYFDVDNGPFDFRYTAREAWLLLQLKRLYHFGEPPARRGGALVWSARFGSDQVTVRVSCARPQR